MRGKKYSGQYCFNSIQILIPIPLMVNVIPIISKNKTKANDQKQTYRYLLVTKIKQICQILINKIRTVGNDTAFDIYENYTFDLVNFCSYHELYKSNAFAPFAPLDTTLLWQYQQYKRSSTLHINFIPKFSSVLNSCIIFIIVHHNAQYISNLSFEFRYTAQKIKFSIKDFFRKYD